MAQWFFELNAGEVPALMQKNAQTQMVEWLTNTLKELNLTPQSIQSFISPTRFGAVVEGLPQTQPTIESERRGPRTDAPQSALDGFLNLTGKTKEQLEIRETPKGSFYFDTFTAGGTPLVDLIPQVLDRFLTEFSWPKQMSWSTGSRSWIRPLKSGYCVFDGKPLVFSLNLSPKNHPNPLMLNFKGHTTGHRFLAPQELSPLTFQDYEQELEKGFILIDGEKRRQAIEDQVHKLCAEKGIKPRMDLKLLEEVVGLVEYPFAKMGPIQEEFMHLPPELLMTSMRVHQRYFATEKTDGSLAPYFITIANVPGSDGGKTLMEGNARVLKARLSDANFFYDQDLKAGFIPWLSKLEKVVFHTKLGTTAKRMERIAKLAPLVAPADQVLHLQQVATYAKADLMSLMVNEFPELQGIMGAYYARKAELSEDVCQAIYDQYTPKGPEDALPLAPLSRLYGIMERLDQLMSFFAVGIKPTGSKDPFALRRAALSMIRILEAGQEIALRPLMEAANAIYQPFADAENQPAYLDDLENFMIDRLKVYWRDQGFAHDHIQAVLSKGLIAPLWHLKQRLEALSAFLKDTAGHGPHLLGAYKRANNILLQASKDKPLPSLEEKLLEATVEQDLVKHLNATHAQVPGLLNDHAYGDVMLQLSKLRPLIDAYFEGVMINVDNPQIRDNRLATLHFFRSLLEEVADFSKLEG